MHTLVVFSLLLLGVAQSGMASEVSVETLREIGSRFDEAQLTGNRALLESMVSDDLVFIGSDGARQGKREFIAGWTDPDVHFAPVTIVAPYVVALGPDAGIVGGEAVLRGTANSRPFASHIRFADTFRRVEGRWQAVHIQVTRIPPAGN